MSLCTVALRRREETGPGLGICFSLPILPIADWYTTWRTRVVGRRARIQRINYGDLKAGKTSKVHREGLRRSRTGDGLARVCRARLDLQDKLAAKCAWQRVPDRVSLLCSHPGFSPRTHTHTPLALYSAGVWRQGIIYSGKKRGREREDTVQLWGVFPPHSFGPIRPLTELRWVFFPPVLSSFFLLLAPLFSLRRRRTRLVADVLACFLPGVVSLPRAVTLPSRVVFGLCDTNTQLVPRHRLSF